MDVISAITTALIAGAAAGLKESSSKIVNDSYATIKDYLQRKFPSVVLAIHQLEQIPDSKARRAVLEEDLNTTNAANDMELLSQAQNLLKILEEQIPNLSEITGVSISDIKAASLHITDIYSAGVGVRVEKANVTGDIEIQGVRAGLKEYSSPNE